MRGAMVIRSGRDRRVNIIKRMAVADDQLTYYQMSRATCNNIDNRRQTPQATRNNRVMKYSKENHCNSRSRLLYVSVTPDKPNCIFRQYLAQTKHEDCLKGHTLKYVEIRRQRNASQQQRSSARTTNASVTHLRTAPLCF